MGKYWTYQRENSIIIRRLRADVKLLRLTFGVVLLANWLLVPLLFQSGSKETRYVFRSVAVFQFFLEFFDIIDLMIS